MRYVSPASLFADALPYPLDKKSIQLGRKKMLAELELSSGDTLEINGTPFTKSDILDYFDQLQENDHLDWYNIIEEDRVLSDFLQNARIENNRSFKTQQLYTDPSFIRWISAWFLTAFQRFTDTCFKSINDDGLRTILRNPLLMTEQDQETAWIAIAKILNNNIAFLAYQRDRLKKNLATISILEELSGPMGFGYINMIRLLPEDRFSPLMDRYANMMVQTSVYTFNKFPQDRTWPVIWIENACQLAVSEDVRSEIADKLEEVRNITEQQEKKKKKSHVGHLIWVAVIVLKVITLGSWHSTPTPSIYNSAPFTITNGDSLIRALKSRNMDSVFVHPAPQKTH